MVLPILLLIVFALTELSLYFWTQSRAEKAVQLGLRRAVVSDPVAVGPGLDPAGSEAWWDGLPLGLRCYPAGAGPGPCPAFAVACDLEAGCRCDGGCRFGLDRARLDGIVQTMRAVLPDLRPENVRVGYRTNGFGYVGRPLPVPVDVTVSLVGMRYSTLFLGDLFGASLPLQAQAQRPSEDLLSR
ncbi:hypothetical protein MPOCJGCO_2141 [Methylobacterium trifolii]|uniref:TadE-like domain-containing protein n=2 Tax=Methylobacterium trifolii TaxID=1003092 RepID=A0ABQ4TYT6_9HYPH|nr:hypothetical protein MPOCJGCO_2141 [Methylobacterium trifolii]